MRKSAERRRRKSIIICLTPFAAPPSAGQPFGARSRIQPFLTGTCEDCDADEDIRGYGWRLITRGRAKAKLAFDESRDQRCPGHGDRRAPKPMTLRLARSGRYTGPNLERHGQLGGWPRWAQAHPEWPEHCGKPMFFVAGIHRYDYGGTGAHDYGFACECGDGAQVVQMT